MVIEVSGWSAGQWVCFQQTCLQRSWKLPFNQQGHPIGCHGWSAVLSQLRSERQLSHHSGRESSAALEILFGEPSSFLFCPAGLLNEKNSNRVLASWTLTERRKPLRWVKYYNAHYKTNLDECYKNRYWDLSWSVKGSEATHVLTSPTWQSISCKATFKTQRWCAFIQMTDQ